MKSIFVAVAILALTPSLASAQQPSAPAAVATLSGSSPIEALMASPTAKPLVLKHFPDLDKHPAYETFKAISLRDLAPLSGGLITEEKIISLETELKSGS